MRSAEQFASYLRDHVRWHHLRQLVHVVPERRSVFFIAAYSLTQELPRRRFDYRSKHRLPHTSGQGSRSTILSRSNYPGVTTPPGTSRLRFQSGASINDNTASEPRFCPAREDIIRVRSFSSPDAPAFGKLPDDPDITHVENRS